MTTTATDRPVPSTPAADGPAGGPAPTSGPVELLVRRVVPLGLVLAVFAMLARTAAEPLSNPDTFFHLRFGHEFLSGAWSLRHPGSVTDLGTADWAPTQWLPQVVMAWLERKGGLAAVAWFSGLQLVAYSLTLYLVARRWSDPVVAAPLTMLLVLASTSGLSMRPQVVSYLLAAFFTAAWCRARTTGRVPWELVPLTWLWATYHGMWPVGIVIGAVACVGIALDRAVTARRGAALAAVPVLCAVAASTTPVGPRLWAAVVGVSGRGRYFSEWGPTDFTQPHTLVLLVVLGTTTVVLLRRPGPPERWAGSWSSSWTAVLLLGLAVAWALYSSRTVPVSAAMATPLAAAALQQLLPPRAAPARSERALVWGGAATTLVVLALVTPHTAAQAAPQPAWAEPALSALPAGTRVLSDSSYGGVLMWAYPQLDVVMSGYGDIYTDAELQRNADLEAVAAGWDDLVRSTGSDWALVSPRRPLGAALLRAGWQTVRTDPDVVLLHAPGGGGS